MPAATAQTLASGAASPGDATRSGSRPWPRRRRWLSRVSLSTQLTTGCRAWLLLLAHRSDDKGTAVYGSQLRMGEHMGCSRRSVTRYAAEAEAAGLIKVVRSHPLRGPQGTFVSRRTNRYCFTTPKADPAPTDEGLRRVRKAGYCVLKPRSDLHDSHGTRPASEEARVNPPLPKGDYCSPETGELIPFCDPEAHERGMEMARAALRASRPGGLRR
jgi:hypothetical protein